MNSTAVTPLSRRDDRDGHAPVTPPEVEGEERRTTSPIPPTSTEDGLGGGEQIALLVQRGVVPANAGVLIGQYSPERIANAVAWFDQQRAGSVGPGMLVQAVQQGREPVRRVSAVDEQVAYGERICAWLAEHFPDVCTCRNDRPHPAAIAAVIRLHHRDGKGALRRGSHGSEIRAAVRAFDAKWMTTEGAQV